MLLASRPSIRRRWVNVCQCAIAWLALGATMLQAQDAAPPPTLEQVLSRLDAAEASIAELELQNKKLTDELSADEPEVELPKAEKEEEKEKEKQWYDKIKLRGYAQLRYNYPLHLDDGSAPPQHPADVSVSPDQEFFLRRARLTFYGDVSDHLYVYMQPEFAGTPDGATDNIYFAQIRDWYGDIYLDPCKENRIRVGQTKVPYGWENLQSSANRLPLDRNDAFNSATRNERDLGLFYYWTPEWAQELFKKLTDDGLKGSGNYGIFAVGVHNGQGGAIREYNDNLHVNARLTFPYTLPDGQVVEFGVQGYTGQYSVQGAAIAPLGIGPSVVPLGTRARPGGEEGMLDQRLGWSFVYYPQPLGFQAEYTIGEGPELNASQTAVERGSLKGGYAMLYHRHQTQCYGEIWPYLRWQTYEGGYKYAANSPRSNIDECSAGVEWQFSKSVELVTELMLTDRTNLTALSSGRSYNQFAGDLLRFQLQINY